MKQKRNIRTQHVHEMDYDTTAKIMPEKEQVPQTKSQRIEQAIYRLHSTGVERLRELLSRVVENAISNADTADAPVSKRSLSDTLEFAPDNINLATEQIISLVDELEQHLF